MNRSLFATPSRAERAVKAVPAADTVNNAGGKAYRMTPEHALAQFAVTGCLSDTFYVTAADQLDTILSMVADKSVGAHFVAQVALYGRLQNMKDAPVLLLACLAVCGESDLFNRVAPTVCDTLKQVSNLVKVIRSGKVQGVFGTNDGKGSTSLPQVVRKFVRSWLTSRDPDRLLNDSVGIDPKLPDLLQIAHPKPSTPEQAATFAYFLGKKLSAEQSAALPTSIRDFEAFKTAKGEDRAKLIGWINFRLLDSLGLTDAEWLQIAQSASWQTARMNLNTFARHGVFGAKGMATKIAAKLSNKDEVKRAHAMPYQLFAAFKATEDNARGYAGYGSRPATAPTEVPAECRLALQQAYETAVSLIPALPGHTAVAVDCSGSMGSHITGRQGNSKPSVITCNEGAALIAATIVRGSPNSSVMRFDYTATRVKINPLDSVMTNAAKIAANGGSTNCSAPVQLLLDAGEECDTIVIISDYESWKDSTDTHAGLGRIWARYRAKFPRAKLICIDLSPNTTLQVKGDHEDGIYHIGGFADAVFPLIQRFARGENKATWLDTIKAIRLPEPGVRAGKDVITAAMAATSTDEDEE